jgi:hypothetical protein
MTVFSYPWEEEMKRLVIQGIAPVEEIRLRGTHGELLGRIRFRWWSRWRKRVDEASNTIRFPVVKDGMPLQVELYKHRKISFMFDAKEIGLIHSVKAYDTVELRLWIENRRLVDILALRR